MKNELRYLLIIQPGGLPLFSQSFNFKTDFQCQSFDNRINELEINSVLVGGLFEAIKDLFSEVIKEQLKLIDIGFFSYRVTGLVYERFLFVGIFDKVQKEENLPREELFPYMTEIAEVFINKHPDVLKKSGTYDISKFENFSQDLIEIGFNFSSQDCRNCLTKCIEENKQCLPHLFYFNKSKQISEF